jgi:hypothetical protein
VAHPKIERLESVRNGRPVVAIDRDLLERLEAEGDEELVQPKESGSTMKQDAPKPEKASGVIKPKLTGEE